MGFFTPTRTYSTAKLINSYIKERTKERQVLNNQMQRLNEQLQSGTIDNYTYERLKDALEINDIKQRDKILEKTIRAK
jgi:hypothetical protein